VKVTVKVLDVNTGEFRFCRVWIDLYSVADVSPAPSDQVVWYGSMIVLRDGSFFYCRETPTTLLKGMR
jgi:hypothetical protein